MRITTKAFRMTPVGVASILVVASLLPGVASAEYMKPPIVKPAETNAAQAPFCANLQTKASTQSGRFSSLESTLTDAKTKHLTTLQGNWGTFETKLSGLQSQWQQDRNNEYAKLATYAKTSAEQTAVTTYETAVNTAISARESANATARTTYQNGVTAAANTEIASINAADTALQTAVNNAVTTAEASCQSGTSVGTIESTLSSSINSARQTFETSVQSARSTFQSTVKSLQATESSTISQNDATFQSAVQAATTALKSAFGQS